MKGYGSSLAPVHAGIKFDLESLLMKFKEGDSMRYRVFADIFRTMEMNLIYAGRQSPAELVEFSERLLQSAAAYILSRRGGARPDYQPGASQADSKEEVYTSGHVNSTMERIFGIYACYAFYYLQPVDYVVQIRVTPAHMDEMRQFVHEVLVPERHLDTAACLFKLVDDAAFKIVAFDLCYDPVCHRRYDMNYAEEDASEEPEEPMLIAKGIVDDPLVKQIEIIHRKYEEGKKLLKVQKEANIIRTNVSEQMRKTYANYRAEVEESHKMLEKERQIEQLEKKLRGAGKQKESRSSIKEAAYKSKIVTSRTRRYLDSEQLDQYQNARDEAAAEEVDAGDVTSPESVPELVVKNKPAKKGKRNSRAKGANKEETRDPAETVANTPATVVETPVTSKKQAPRKRGGKKSQDTVANVTEDVEELNSVNSDPVETTPKTFGRVKAPKKKAVKMELVGASPKKNAKSVQSTSGGEAAVLDMFEMAIPDSPKKKKQPPVPRLDEDFELSMMQYEDTPEEIASRRALKKLLGEA